MIPVPFSFLFPVVRPIFFKEGNSVNTNGKTGPPRLPAPAIMFCLLLFFLAMPLSLPSGAVPGDSRQSRVLGDITVEADSIVQSGPNYVAAGNITLAVNRAEPVLSVGDPPGGAASLYFDPGGIRLWTESPVLLGALGIRRHSQSTPKLWNLYRGNIRIDSTTTDPSRRPFRSRPAAVNPRSIRSSAFLSYMWMILPCSLLRRTPSRFPMCREAFPPSACPSPSSRE